MFKNVPLLRFAVVRLVAPIVLRLLVVQELIDRHTKLQPMNGVSLGRGSLSLIHLRQGPHIEAQTLIRQRRAQNQN